ncbi:unnamed protein product [Thelazia callipaeda]|uniref:Uncharacterized protein n=1 Tax=Thelazia callipaeda TaxID=103827 RepID=A0A0N5CU17_THECL|nr:unnamed protein product [Thelazia callipaeda]
MRGVYSREGMERRVLGKMEWVGGRGTQTSGTLNSVETTFATYAVVHICCYKSDCSRLCHHHAALCVFFRCTPH